MNCSFVYLQIVKYFLYFVVVRMVCSCRGDQCSLKTCSFIMVRESVCSALAERIHEPNVPLRPLGSWEQGVAAFQSEVAVSPQSTWSDVGFVTTSRAVMMAWPTLTSFSAILNVPTPRRPCRLRRLRNHRLSILLQARIRGVDVDQ